MLSAERLFCGFDVPRPAKEAPRAEEEAVAAVSSELEAELKRRDLVRPLWKRSNEDSLSI
jgi:hypothetical protein